MNKHEKLKELIAKTKGNEWRKDATGKEYPVVSDAMDSLNFFCGDSAEAFDKLIDAVKADQAKYAVDGNKCECGLCLALNPFTTEEQE